MCFLIKSMLTELLSCKHSAHIWTGFQWLLSVCTSRNLRRVPVSLTICFCNAQRFVVACACVPSSFEDHKYGRSSRQTRRPFSMLVNNASEVVTFSHPLLRSFSSAIHLFAHFPPRSTVALQTGKKRISLETNQSETWHRSHLYRKSSILW